MRGVAGNLDMLRTISRSNSASRHLSRKGKLYHQEVSPCGAQPPRSIHHQSDQIVEPASVGMRSVLLQVQAVQNQLAGDSSVIELLGHSNVDGVIVVLRRRR